MGGGGGHNLPSSEVNLPGQICLNDDNTISQLTKYSHQNNWRQQIVTGGSRQVDIHLVHWSFCYLAEAEVNFWAVWGENIFFPSILSSDLPGLQNSLHGRVSISGSWFSRRPSRRVLCLVSSPKGSPRLQSAEHLDHSDQSPMSPEKINEITLQTISFEIGYHPLLIFRSSS